MVATSPRGGYDQSWGRGQEGNELVCCFESGLACVPLGLEMVVRGEFEVWGRAGRMWFGQGESRGFPGLGPAPWEVSETLQATLKCLAWLELRAWPRIS